MDLTWKIASTGALALAGFAAGKVAELGWRAATGRPAPVGEDDDSTLLQIVAFAAASAAVAAVAQHYASRTAARLYDPTGAKGIYRAPGTPRIELEA